MKDCFGPATVFMSHCWGAKFGDLIGAACHGARTDRVVWIDIFAKVLFLRRQLLMLLLVIL